MLHDSALYKFTIDIDIDIDTDLLLHYWCHRVFSMSGGDCPGERAVSWGGGVKCPRISKDLDVRR